MSRSDTQKGEIALSVDDRDDSDETKSTLIMVDDIQASIQKLVETVMGSAKVDMNTVSTADVSAAILQDHRNCLRMIDNLLGIDKSVELQQQEAITLSILVASKRDNILTLEQNLLKLTTDIDKELNQVRLFLLYTHVIPLTETLGLLRGFIVMPLIASDIVR
jgi:hypothetical protein